MDRGELWVGNLSPTVGRKQAGVRPLLIVSADTYNSGPSQLVVVVPLTSSLRDLPFRVRVNPPEGGLRLPSDVLCDQVRAVAKARLTSAIGHISQETLAAVEERLRSLFDLYP